MTEEQLQAAIRLDNERQRLNSIVQEMLVLLEQQNYAEILRMAIGHRFGGISPELVEGISETFKSLAEELFKRIQKKHTEITAQIEAL